MTAQFWKALDPGGRPRIASTDFRWPLPNGKPGAWTPPIEKLDPCVSGYHLCRRDDLVKWLGPEIYEAEHDGTIIESNDKIVVRSARLLRRVDTWNKRTQRLFACDCAKRVMPIFERQRPNDERPRRCIAVSRLFADGLATSEELTAAGTAARAAAWAAAEAATGAAARAASGAAWAAVEAAAGAAAGAAAEDAAGAAAGAAAENAAGAAGDAARAAAWAAAENAAWAAAWDAAGAAAEDAAGAAAGAAWDAAGDAEREWQTERLFTYLYGNAP